MPGLEHASGLLEMARRDLAALRGMSTDTIAFSDEVVGFHAQQACEKAVKAVLAKLDVSYRKTHDLEELFGLAKDNGTEIPGRFLALVDLADFAVQYRYEPFCELDGPLDRPSLVDSVSEFLDWARDSCS